eukprot:1211173-Amorphochlora_amoeboformis.AAC.1
MTRARASLTSTLTTIVLTLIYSSPIPRIPGVKNPNLSPNEVLIICLKLFNTYFAYNEGAYHKLSPCALHFLLQSFQRGTIPWRIRK